MWGLLTACFLFRRFQVTVSYCGSAGSLLQRAVVAVQDARSNRSVLAACPLGHEIVC